MAPSFQILKSIEMEDVLLYGPPRCGTSWLHQVTEALLKQYRPSLTLERTHEYVSPSQSPDLLICIQRDLRDAILSFTRIHTNCEVSHKHIRRHAPSYKHRIDQLRKMQQDHPDAFWINYEDVWGNVHKLLNMICPYLDIGISEEFADSLEEEFGLQKNFERSSRKGIFWDGPDENLMNPQHINPESRGKPGGWKKMDQKSIEILEYFAGI